MCFPICKMSRCPHFFFFLISQCFKIRYAGAEPRCKPLPSGQSLKVTGTTVLVVNSSIERKAGPCVFTKDPVGTCCLLHSEQTLAPSPLLDHLPSPRMPRPRASPGGMLCLCPILGSSLQSGQPTHPSPERTSSEKPASVNTSTSERHDEGDASCGLKGSFPPPLFCLGAK